MECPYCKAVNRDSTRYCGHCGRLIALPNVPPPPTIPASSPAGNPAPFSQPGMVDSSYSPNTPIPAESGSRPAYPSVPPNVGSGSGSSLVPGSRLQGGRYIIKQVLGQGGMGAALIATDNRLAGKVVVIKELISSSINPAQLQDDVRNFKREVATLAHIDHPLIPNVTDHFQEGLRYFMVQEYIEGENSGRALKPDQAAA